jgi:putative hemolysin
MLVADFTKEPALVRQAQELRYRVFAGEMGASLGPAAASGIDEDRFDAHCEHLVVREARKGRVVGTYRILSPDAALRAGGYYAEGQFDLALLDVLRGRMVEVGRACVDPEFRGGNVMLVLWSALARYLVDNGHDFVLGSCSLDLADGGHRAASIFRAACARSASPEDYRVYPRRPLPLARLRDALPAAPPSLLRAYLNLGAWVCGEPAWDHDFSCADLPLLLPLARMHGRYARHFLAQAA